MVFGSLTDRQQQVYELLLMPIECDKKVQDISLENGIVHTGQKYISSYADPDMSDFAVGFYDVLYGSVLDGGRILDSSFFFANTDFAGDTMNSFQSIANVTPGAGASANERAPVEAWPAYLQAYHLQYRCLANFWVIPMKLGRQSMKFSRYDSLDLCLDILAFDYESRLADYPHYLSKLPSFSKFCEIHQISEGRDRSIVTSLYHNNGGEQLVKMATEDIIHRAYRIATSNLSDSLHDYFSAIRLI